MLARSEITTIAVLLVWAESCALGLDTAPDASNVVSWSRGIDTIDLTYYTVADGDGQTQAAREADVDVGGDTRSHRMAEFKAFRRLTDRVIRKVHGPRGSSNHDCTRKHNQRNRYTEPAHTMLLLS
jgi:hypothetical protein